ncbi:MAG: AMP-dependent synthetase/ligase [Brevinema sp.]
MYLNFQHLVDSFEYRNNNIYSRMFDGERYISTSYKILYDNIQSIACYLQQEKGMNKGDKIALMSENRPEWMMMYFGIVYNGIIAVPFDMMLSIEEVRNLIKSSGVEMMGVSLGVYDKLKEDPEIMVLIKEWIIFDSHPSIDHTTNITTFPTIFRYKAKKSLQKQELKRSDLASLIYTSGTTGSPKAVMLSNSNFMQQANNLWQAACLNEQDIALSVLPLHHTFQFSVELTMLAVGAGITYADSIKPNRLIDAVKTTEVTIMIGIPTLYAKILEGIHRNLSTLKVPLKQIIQLLLKISELGYFLTGGHHIGKKLFAFLRKKAGLHTVKFMISGAAPLALQTAKGYAILGFNLSNGYGLTEASPVISVGDPIGFIDNKSVGNVIPKVSWKILDPGLDGIGEICVFGENVMQGYYNNPEATAAVMTEDGWLKTGDMGYILSKKGKEYLYITGRYKNIIVTGGGKNVYPEEIEEQINNHPHILESIVIGVTESDGNLSEIPCALIVLDVIKMEQENIDPDSSEIKELINTHIRSVNNNLQTYQKIRAFAIQKDELHKNSTRKIKRFEYKGSNYRHLLSK